MSQSAEVNWLHLTEPGYYLSAPSSSLPNWSTNNRKMQNPPRNLESIRRDMAERLRPSCGHMSDEEFEKMV
ncbi:MAG: hypothetical protein ABI994_03000, partial [Gemmatimonadales bacterium]